MSIFISILLNCIIPIFILISLGYALDKKFKLDMNTLTKLNFYLFVPAFSFVNIYSTDINLDLVIVVVIACCMIALNFALGFCLRKILKLPYKTAKAFENSLMFYNSGNIGISLITLVFSNEPFLVDGAAAYLQAALSVQIMTMLVQNLTVNTIGFINSGGDGMTLKTGVLRVLKMPPLYAIAAAILFKFIPIDPKTTPIWPSLEYLRAALVSVALVTLGVQLAKTRINMKIKTPYLAAFFRLIGGPAAAFMLIKLFGFQGVTAQAVFLGSSTPTAVNTALLSIECKGDADFAAQTVMISTLLSAFTMTTVAFLAYRIF